MSDLKTYIAKRKKTDKEFAVGVEEGYKPFKIGVEGRLHNKPPRSPLNI